MQQRRDLDGTAVGGQRQRASVHKLGKAMSAALGRRHVHERESSTRTQDTPELHERSEDLPGGKDVEHVAAGEGVDVTVSEAECADIAASNIDTLQSMTRDPPSGRCDHAGCEIDADGKPVWIVARELHEQRSGAAPRLDDVAATGFADEIAYASSYARVSDSALTS